MASRRKLRIAIYSQDGLGLGHLRRNIHISRCLLERAPDSNVLLFTDSPVAPFFHLPDFVDHVKIPSVRKITAGLWRPTRLNMEGSEIRRLRCDLLLRGLISFRPDLFLVDHMPAGAQGELLPALKSLKRVHPNSAIVLGLRDILGAPNVIMNSWRRDGAYDALRLYYDRVLIYGERALFDAARKYRIPEATKGIHYCGYVASGNHVQPARQMWQLLRTNKTKLVLVAAGGGADGQYLMHTYLETIRSLGSRANLATLMAVGVNAPPEVFRELKDKAQGFPVQVVRYVGDFIEHLAATDLIVCMAGYNTLTEVLTLRKKALVVPRSGPSAEQKMRAHLFTNRGLIDMIAPQHLSSDRLAKRLTADLDRDDYPAGDKVIDTSGAERAASCLLELVSHSGYGVGSSSTAALRMPEVRTARIMAAEKR